MIVDMAKGYSARKGRRKIAIDMPEEVFDKIANRAKTDDVSFNAMAVRLLECGLFDYEESEQYEPVAEDAQKLGD